MDFQIRLKQWVADTLQAEAESLDWQPLLGDASFRSYTRCIWQDKSYIAAYAPPASEKNHEFVSIAKHLREAGIEAPAIIAVDYQQGFLLQSDLGQLDLQSVLSQQTVDAYYSQAMQLIAQMQTVACDRLPRYDRQLLALELSLFSQWFVESLLDYSCSEHETAMLERSFDLLLDSALEQPQAFVHRDYHCRNILVQAEGLAVIDFQDAVCGPVTYDLVSLLRDCYVVWPAEKVGCWLEQFRTEYFADIDEQQFKRWFDFMGLQRHIKVLGIFARLSKRDSKDRYLADLPTVIAYVLNVAGTYTELEEFVCWFKQKLLPLVRLQSWGEAL